MPGDGAPRAASDGASRPADDTPTGDRTQRPTAMLYGAGHVVVYGNPPFIALFGAGCIGLPAAEALIDLPHAAFAVMDVAYREGRLLACRVPMLGGAWRMTVAERRDIGTGEVYGIAVRLVPQEQDQAVG
jgi:hypothetical protein